MSKVPIRIHIYIQYQHHLHIYIQHQHPSPTSTSISNIQHPTSISNYIQHPTSISNIYINIHLHMHTHIQHIQHRHSICRTRELDEIQWKPWNNALCVALCMYAAAIEHTQGQEEQEELRVEQHNIILW